MNFNDPVTSAQFAGLRRFSKTLLLSGTVIDMVCLTQHDLLIHLDEAVKTLTLMRDNHALNLGLKPDQLK